MEHASPANYTHWTPKLNEFVVYFVHAIAVSVAFNVTQIADVTDLAIWTTMIVAERVIVLTCGYAAVCQVAKLMDVEAMFVIRREASELTLYVSGSKLPVLFKPHNSFGARAAI